MKRPSDEELKRLMKDKRMGGAEKVELPKEDPKMIEYRTLQNIMYFCTSANIQLKNPEETYKAAVALKEVFEFCLPRIQNLEKELGLDKKLEEAKKEKKGNKAKAKKEAS